MRTFTTRRLRANTARNRRSASPGDSTEAQLIRFWAYDKFEYQADIVDQIDSQLAGSDPPLIERTLQQMLDEIRSLGGSTVANGSSSTPKH
jgi:hypothetical protein